MKNIEFNIQKRNMGQYLGIYRFNLGRKNKIPSLKPKRSFIDRIKLKYNLTYYIKNPGTKISGFFLIYGLLV